MIFIMFDNKYSNIKLKSLREIVKKKQRPYVNIYIYYIYDLLTELYV